MAGDPSLAAPPRPLRAPCRHAEGKCDAPAVDSHKIIFGVIYRVRSVHLDLPPVSQERFQMTTIKVFRRLPDESVDVNPIDELDLSKHFDGHLPQVGDTILGTALGTDGKRIIWTVLQRALRPRDLHDYVALVVDERDENEKGDDWIVG